MFDDITYFTKVKITMPCCIAIFFVEFLRYGDALNPWGDRITIAKAWCVSKPNAKMLLGVPTVAGENDKIEWTANRIYGDVMMPHLTANWIPLKKFRPYGRQGGFIFAKLDTKVGVKLLIKS